MISKKYINKTKATLLTKSSRARFSRLSRVPIKLKGQKWGEFFLKKKNGKIEEKKFKVGK